MTNQTIGGVLVPRELLSYWAECLESAGFKDRPAEMRALLDARPIMCHGCMTEGVAKDHFDSAGKCKAAQSHGEPVAYRYKELQQAWENEKPWELATVALGLVYLERKELAERGVLVGKERETYLGLTVEPLYAAQPQGEPVAFTAVGVLQGDGDGGLAPEWILEGGTSELWAGAVLLIADEDQELCAEDGHCELYRNPPEQPAAVAVVPERLEMTDGLHTYEYVTGHNAAIDKMLGVKS